MVAASQLLDQKWLPGISTLKVPKLRLLWSINPNCDQRSKCQLKKKLNTPHPKRWRFKLKYCLRCWVSQCTTITESLTQTPAATLKSSPTRCFSDSSWRKAGKNRKRRQLVTSATKQTANYKLTNQSRHDKKFANQTAWLLGKLHRLSTPQAFEINKPSVICSWASNYQSALCLSFKSEGSRCRLQELCRLLQNKV